MVEYPTKNFIEEWQRSKFGASAGSIKTNQANGFPSTGNVKLTAVNKSIDNDKQTNPT